MYYSSFNFYLRGNVDDLLCIFMYFIGFAYIKDSIVVTTINLSYMYI